MANIRLAASPVAILGQRSRDLLNEYQYQVPLSSSRDGGVQGPESGVCIGAPWNLLLRSVLRSVPSGGVFPPSTPSRHVIVMVSCQFIVE